MLKQLTQTAKQKSQTLLNEHYPKLEQAIVKKLSNVDEKTSDNFIETVFDNAYEVLPLVVRLVVSKEDFLNFMAGKKERIKKLVIAQHAKSNPKKSTPTPKTTKSTTPKTTKPTKSPKPKTTPNKKPTAKK